MGTNTERFLHNPPTSVTFLARESWVHSYHPMSSILSFGSEDVKKSTPTGVHNTLGEMMVFDHVADSQVFNHDPLILFSIGLGGLELVIAPLACDLEMSLGDVLSSFLATVATLLPPGQLTLFASQGMLRAAIEARVLHRLALGISQEGLQTHINANIRVLAGGKEMFLLWFRLTYNESVPMSIRTQDQVYHLGQTLYWAMQFDLECVSQLLGNHEVFLVLVQVAIFAILP